MHERVSVNSLCFLGTSLDEQEKYWQELSPHRISFISQQVFQEGEDKARAIIESGGYQVATLSHAFHMAALSYDDDVVKPARENLSRAIRFAASVGAETIYMVTGGRGTMHWEQAAECFAAAIAPCVDEAGEAGIPLCIETAPFVYATNHFAHTLRDTITLAEIANVDICIDLFSTWWEADLKHTIERALPSCRLVQVGDYTLGDASLPARAVPGDGSIPLDDMIGWIVKGGYSGPFDLELLGPRINEQGQLKAAGRAAEYVSNLLEKLGA